MPRDESRGGMPEGVRSSTESGTPSALLWGLAWNAQSKQRRVHPQAAAHLPKRSSSEMAVPRVGRVNSARGARRQQLSSDRACRNAGFVPYDVHVLASFIHKTRAR